MSCSSHSRGSQLQICSMSHNSGRRGDTYSREEMKDVLSITFTIWKTGVALTNKSGI